MKPMILKKPTKCCKSPTLTWTPNKQHFKCPCGKTKADDLGRLIVKRSTGGVHPGRPKKQKYEPPEPPRFVEQGDVYEECHPDGW